MRFDKTCKQCAGRGWVPYSVVNGSNLSAGNRDCTTCEGSGRVLMTREDIEKRIQELELELTELCNKLFEKFE